MTFQQTKIKPMSNKSFIVKNAKPTVDKSNLDLSQVAAINFKHAKIEKSFIPSVPINYTRSKQQKPGKTLIPRFMAIYSKQAENKKSSSHVNGINRFNLKKDKKTSGLVKNRSYIPRKAAKKVETLPNNIQQKSQQKLIKLKPASLFGKFGKSKIPVLASTVSTKKTKKARRLSHSESCKICSPAKKENARISRLDAIQYDKMRNANATQDDQVRVVTYNEIKTIKTQTHVLTFNIIKNDDIPSCISTASSIKRSLIPVRNLTNTLFKKRVSPIQPSALTSFEQDELESISTIASSNKYQIIAQDFNKKTNSIVCISLKNKHTQLQKSVNKPEASISISHSQVEVSTITSIIRPELSSISLLHKAEKDLSSTRHQIEENGEGDSPSLFGNVIKTIVRFSKDLFSKML